MLLHQFQKLCRQPILDPVVERRQFWIAAAMVSITAILHDVYRRLYPTF